MALTVWLRFVMLCGCAAAAAPDIPSLAWSERADWVNVKTDVTPGAIGDGRADDTAAIQQAFAGVASGAVIYFPAGTYRITSTLTLKAAKRVVGVMIVGHGRDTKLIWDGPEGQPLWLASGVAHSRYTGLSFDGRGKASVGLQNSNEKGGFGTEIGYRHLAFRNFTDSGMLARGAPATAEVTVENSVFERCGRGVAILGFNHYDWTIDGCRFRRCGIAVECDHGNAYIRNSRFEGSTEVDIKLTPEHGSSVRRCISVGSQAFVVHSSGISPLTLQDCQVAGWRNPDWAVSLAGAPAVVFDCVFSKPPGRTPPIRPGKLLVVSQNFSAETDGVVIPNIGTVHEIPAGERKRSLRSTEHRFLRDTAEVPAVVFDAVRDFGALADGKSDDTAAIQQAIDAAREHGSGAIAYLPTGKYVVTAPLRITGAGYTVGGTGFKTGLQWQGAEGGTMIEVVDPQAITLENLNVGSHDVATKMNNAYDILQTGTLAKSSITYDNVIVYGMYQRDPERKGLWLRELPKGAVVRVAHLQGNIHLQDAARATVLLANSFEGSVVVEGKGKERDGFFGIMTRLGTICTHVLYVRDSHSVVASDFYVEQALNGFSFSGNPWDPPGLVTLQLPKMHVTKNEEGPPGEALAIHGYYGRIAIGPAQFYSNPEDLPLRQHGKQRMELLVWAASSTQRLPCRRTPRRASRCSPVPRLRASWPVRRSRPPRPAARRPGWHPRSTICGSSGAWICV